MHEILFFFVFIGILGVISYFQILIIRDRNFRSFEKEILNYLSQHSLDLIEIRIPTEIDWEDRCFDKPPMIQVSLVTVRIGGMMVNWSDKQYKVIEATDHQGRLVRVWLEVITTYFHKPILTFKKYRPSNFFNPPKIGFDQNVTTVKYVCPACGWKLDGSETQCPECELHFQ